MEGVGEGERGLISWVLLPFSAVSAHQWHRCYARTTDTLGSLLSLGGGGGGLLADLQWAYPGMQVHQGRDAETEHTCHLRFAHLCVCLQAKKASAQSMAGGDYQAAIPACAPQQQSGAPLGETCGSAHSGRHKEVVPSTDAHASGQTPEIGGQAERQPPGTEGQGEREPPGTTGQAEREPLGTEGQGERELQGNTPRDQQGSGSEGSELEAARAVWHSFRDLLPVQRCWWVKLHFR